MVRAALERHLLTPAAVNRETGALLSFDTALAQPDAVADLAALPVDKQVELVKARWLAGDWEDLIYGTAGLIDRNRAIAELEARSAIGLDLLAVELEALRLLYEDAATSRKER